MGADGQQFRQVFWAWIQVMNKSPYQYIYPSSSGRKALLSSLIATTEAKTHVVVLPIEVHVIPSPVKPA